MERPPRGADKVPKGGLMTLVNWTDEPSIPWYEGYEVPGYLHPSGPGEPPGPVSGAQRLPLSVRSGDAGRVARLVDAICGHRGYAALGLRQVAPLTALRGPQSPLPVLSCLPLGSGVSNRPENGSQRIFAGSCRPVWGRPPGVWGSISRAGGRFEPFGDGERGLRVCALRRLPHRAAFLVGTSSNIPCFSGTGSRLFVLGLGRLGHWGANRSLEAQGSQVSRTEEIERVLQVAPGCPGHGGPPLAGGRDEPCWARALFG